MVALLLMWFGIDLPLTFLGFYFGYRYIINLNDALCRQGLFLSEINLIAGNNRTRTPFARTRFLDRCNFVSTLIIFVTGSLRFENGCWKVKYANPLRFLSGARTTVVSPSRSMHSSRRNPSLRSNVHRAVLHFLGERLLLPMVALPQCNNHIDPRSGDLGESILLSLRLPLHRLSHSRHLHLADFDRRHVFHAVCWGTVDRNDRELVLHRCPWQSIFYNLQNYHWWWRSFVVSGGSAVYGE